MQPPENTTHYKMPVPYFQVPNAVFDIGLDHYELVVYMCLARYSNQDSTAYPSYSTIAKNCGISKRKAIDVVQSLVNKGIILKEKRYNSKVEYSSNTYRVKTNIKNTGAHRASPYELDSLDGAHRAPNKELDYKKNNNNNKGIFLMKISKITFQEYVETFTPSGESIRVISYYLDKYRKCLGTDHPKLRPNQWENVTILLFTCYDDIHSREFSLVGKELITMIDVHFETDYKNCDYNIIHFCNNEIKLRRYYEAIH